MRGILRENLSYSKTLKSQPLRLTFLSGKHLLLERTKSLFEMQIDRHLAQKSPKSKRFASSKFLTFVINSYSHQNFTEKVEMAEVYYAIEIGKL